jgi:NitT/TauT family transport system ATP-binding protein
VVFQETALFPWMTTLNNIKYGPRVQRERSEKDIEKEAVELLEIVGLLEFGNRYPIQLSGGMQRRAELARALINHPKVLLMDEPFRGLDAMTRELMQEYLLRLFEGSNRTVLFVTSEIDEAIFFADKLIIMGRSPCSVKSTIEDDLPRPRTREMLTSQRYAELKEQALSILYKEAVGAFATGEQQAADMVEAYEKRQTE